MALIRSVPVGRQIIDFHKFTGVVIDEKKWSSTSLAGGGGGYNVGSGQNNPVSISSITITNEQFFLKDDSGQEMAFQFSGNIAVRVGNRMTVIWAVIQGKNVKYDVAVINHDTRTPIIFTNIIGQSVLPIPILVQLMWVVSFFAICFYGLGIVALIALWGLRRKEKRACAEALQQEVDKLVSDNMK
jgi:hypothetical protein